MDECYTHTLIITIHDKDSPKNRLAFVFSEYTELPDDTQQSSSAFNARPVASGQGVGKTITLNCNLILMYSTVRKKKT